jgi:integrase
VASIDRWKGNRWRARWRTPDGQSRSQVFDRKVDAEKFLVSVEHSKNVGVFIDRAAGRLKFGEFAEQWLDAQTFDESTREAVATRLRVHINPTFERTELRAIRPSAIQAWLRGRQNDCAPRYVRVLLANLSSILGAAVEDGLIARNPCSSSAVRAPAVEQQRIVPWTQEQVRAVVEAHPEAYRAIPIVAAGAGLRQGEVFGLRVEDIDFLGRTLHVRQQVRIVHNQLEIAPPKRGKVREVPLAEPVARALAERLRLFPPGDDGLVFTSREHKMLNRNYFNARIWKPALKKAGIETTRANGMHALRHYFASVLLDAGESVRSLADYLGHSDPGFTLRVYTHLMPASADRARRAVESAFADDSSRVTVVSRDAV